MLLALSIRYNRLIALGFLYLFILSGLGIQAAPVQQPRYYYRSQSADRQQISYPAFTTTGHSETAEATAVPAPLTTGSTSLASFVPDDSLAKKLEQQDDIGGPSQPEMSGFKPVGADNMVDLFSGDFSYNIPLLDVGGYPVNIFYNSGISMDQESSWVGLGWNINPGTIMRNMRGLPDDFNGKDSITKVQYVRPDNTYGVKASANIEAFGFDLNNIGVNFDASVGIFYNNMRGIGLNAAITPSIGIGSLGGDEKTKPLSFAWSLGGNSQTGGTQTFSMSLAEKNKSGMTGSLTASIGYHSRVGLQSLNLDAEVRKTVYVERKSGDERSVSAYSFNPTMGTSIGFAYPSIVPSIRTKFFNQNYSLDIGTGIDLWGVFGNLRLGGYFSQKKIRDADIETRKAAFGMLYMQQGNDNKDALLDFNRLNDGVYTPNAPTIAIPAYTYDVFSISGEGTGGSFRAYRGDLGYVNDPYMKTGDVSAHLGVELGGGTLGKGGINAQLVLTPSTVGVWGPGNLARKTMAFKQSQADYQSVYFKNPGEKAIPDTVYQAAVGGEDMVRLKMTNTGYGNPTLMPTLLRYSDTRQYKNGKDLNMVDSQVTKKRDKRTQVITFLNAEEASRVGLTTDILSINNPYDSVNTTFGCAANVNAIKRHDLKDASNYRKPHHISEIDVLGQDGRRYVYGIPVYNTKQIDVTFNKTGDATTQLTDYTTPDKTPKQNESKDGYVEKEITPPYAHSFLLTGLLSPNYVDVKGDGITEDDMGDAIKFNYSKLNPIKWRTPVGAGKATFSEGLKTDRHDDKSHYIYGERESWYLYSVESKNMLARFYVKNDRLDSRSVADEDGAPDASWGAQRLYKISLFTKADLLKYGSAAKPVKTVHFEYDYSLCQNVPGNISNAGKLTLRRIFFTYNGNNKSKKNAYRFFYGSVNPNYDSKASDRWGNYKPATNNPGSLSNADYPYTNQDRAYTNNYVKAWTLDSVGLPSGGSIKVHYEADDYGYVQDRRATSMYTIKGFGDTPTPAGGMLTNARLYDNPRKDYEYIYLEVPKAITATDPGAIRAQIGAWYLGNTNKTQQLFMKLSVKIDKGGTEMIPLYATVADYGLVPGNANKVIYIRVSRIESGYTPMVQYTLQFMKNFLPGTAYPGNDVSEQGGIKSIVKAVAGLQRSFVEVFKNGMTLFMAENKCKITTLNQSFVRLTNPDVNKIGGGLRVKKLVIHDNWDKLSAASNGMRASTYGQEYFYTRKEMIGNELKTISSGVASWEPSIGGEENPHREMMTYFNKNKMGPYDYGSVELPLAEMFFPSPSVGYSRVEVRSIHRDTVKNAPGVQVTEFLTNREFPYTSSYTPLEEHNATDEYKSRPLLQLLKIDIRKAVALTQGFKVDMNDMHGRMKKQASYSPDNLIDPVSYTENFYNTYQASDKTYKFNHYFPVVSKPDGIISSNVIGREIEVMTDFRQHTQETISINLNFNLDVINGFVVPIPIPTWFSPVTKEFNTYKSASVLKVVNHYAVLDSVVAVDKGSMVSTKNLVYDAETGNTLLTRTNNEHNRPIYNFSYPAHWAYSGMGLAYKNIDVKYDNLVFRHGKLETPINLSLLESGDEIMVSSYSDNGPVGIVPCDAPVSLPKNTAKKIWAVYTGKSGSATPQFVFIDANGDPYTAANVSIRIIRSGKRNMLGDGVGSIVSLNDPRKMVSSQPTLVFETATNILQTTAAVFKDHWRVDDAFYLKDSVVTTTVRARRHKKEYFLKDNATVYVYARGENDVQQWQSGKLPYLLVSRYNQKRQGRNDPSTKTVERSFLLFDFADSPLPIGAQFDRAYLSLYSHTTPPSANAPVHDGPPAHPNLHGRSTSYSLFEPSLEIKRMTGSWYSPGSAESWKNNYMMAAPKLSSDLVPIPPSLNGYEDYINPGIEISNLVRDNWNTILGQSGKIGLSLNVPGDNSTNNNYSFKFRCFGGIAFPRLKSTVTPALSYYYYVCGDTSNQSNPYNDPLLNVVKDCYSLDTVQLFCRSKFTQRKSMNPYVEGVWGNWRVDSAFVYYGKRKETDPSVAGQDMRTAGTIDGFKTFWNFNSTKLGRNYSASDVWTWNSVITQYNRKGYDIENKDPLGRFNAGLYGYNQQLPIAVVNNSRYREAMFDGFEDYDYQSASCTETCKPPKHARIKDASTYIDSTQKHTGKHSLRVSANSFVELNAPVIDSQSLEKPYSVRVRMDSTTYTDTVINSPGNGMLSASYFNHPYSGKNNIILCPVAGQQGGVLAYSANEYPDIPMYNPPVRPRPGTSVAAEYNSVRWNGKLVVRETGVYQFRVTADNGFRIAIDGSYITNNGDTYGGICGANGNSGGTKLSNPVQLYKGQVYQLQIDHYNQWSLGGFNMTWVHHGIEERIPGYSLYTDTYGSISVTYPTTWCTKLDTVQVRGEALTDTFSLIRGKKMLVSAWVKEGGNDCKCSTYTHNTITVGFTGSAEQFTFAPAGSIIEGWQRYEGVFTIPSSATAIKVKMNSTGSNTCYFDDLRIHPFNANMKSFVYNPSSLRLMAELDENNYGSLYEYDDDGTLIRVKKETERGIKTITETRSALQKAID